MSGGTFHKLAIVLLAAGLLAPAPSFGELLSFDLGASAGYDHVGVDSGNSTPTMGAFALGLTAKVNLLDWFSAGIASEYQFFNQYSDPTPAVGNRTGTRWTVFEPMVELCSGSFSLKASYTFLGSYHLTNATFAGYSDLAYELPRGERIAALMQIEGTSLWGGLYYEQVKYTWANFSTSPLPMQTWQLGVVLELRLLDDRHGSSGGHFSF